MRSNFLSSFATMVYLFYSLFGNCDAAVQGCVEKCVHEGSAFCIIMIRVMCVSAYPWSAASDYMKLIFLRTRFLYSRDHHI